MTKSQALNQFWGGFGVPAYDENSVPDDAVFPYITYTESLDSLGNVLTLTANIWDKSTSWKFVTDKQEEIARRIGEYGHYMVPLDGGGLYLTKGTPFAQRMADSDNDIKRVYLVVMGEFLTKY